LLLKDAKSSTTSKKIEDQKIIFNIWYVREAQQEDEFKGRKRLNTINSCNVVSLNFWQVVRRIKDDSVQRNIEVLRTRLDQFSVAEFLSQDKVKSILLLSFPMLLIRKKQKIWLVAQHILNFKLVSKLEQAKKN